MFNLNPEVSQEGFCAADPESRFGVQSGEQVLTVRVLSNRRWKDKESGEPQEKTTGVFWKAFGKNAENMAALLKKGSHVMVRGEIVNTSWVDEASKETQYRDEYHVRYWKLLDRKDTDAQE